MPDMTQQPDRRGLAQAKMLPLLKVYNDALGGTLAMREAGTEYLPKFEMESEKTYAKRLQSSVFYSATSLTRDALVGLVFRKDPELSRELPEQMQRDGENIDLAGRHFAVFAKDVFRDSWDGYAVIFVDMQRGDGKRSRAEEEAAGLRPYWLNIRAADILRASPINIRGQEMLGRFAFQQWVTLADGEFGERVEHRVRDYRLELTAGGPRVVYSVWAKRKTGQTESMRWQVIEGPDYLRVGGSGPNRGAPLDEIPASVVYTGYEGFYRATPPLLDLAYENIDHYQQRSEHRKAWQYSRVPIPVFPGMKPDAVTIAPDKGITTPTPESKPYYLETKNTALEGSRMELLECERRMANLGAQMLYRPDRSNETATARRIENSQSSSRLATAARGLEDALEAAVRLHAKWRREELEERPGGYVSVAQDFEDFEMDAQMVTALDRAVANGNLRLETFLAALRDGIPVMEAMDPEAEAALLERDQMRKVAEAQAAFAEAAGALGEDEEGAQ